LTDSIAHFGRVEIMDSGFCVLKALIKLASVGVFASAEIKKRRYWPKYIDGGAIDTHFEVNEIGTTDSLPGLLDGVPFRIYCMKEEDYVMKLMATNGTLRPIVEGKTQQSITRRHSQWENVSFQYTGPFSITLNTVTRLTATTTSGNLQSHWRSQSTQRTGH
jgi:hypothetical protein